MHSFSSASQSSSCSSVSQMESFTRDLVSVIIPTFNRAGLIEKAVATALIQDYPHKEIIVVDDGSTDDTRSRLRSLPVKYYCQSNAGPAAARNTGMSHSCGEYLAFLDSDDLWHHNFLSECLRGLSETAAGFAVANWQVVAEDGTVNNPDELGTRVYLKHYLKHPARNWFSLTPAEARHLFVRHSAAPPSATVIRRQCVPPGGWDEKARVGEDRLFLLDAIFAFQCGAAFTMAPLWSYRVHGANVYYGNTNQGKIVQGDIYMKGKILERHGHEMSAEEVKIIRHSMAQDYLDWGYYESLQGRRSSALRCYYESWRLSQRAKPLMAMGRAFLRKGSPAARL